MEENSSGKKVDEGSKLSTRTSRKIRLLPSAIKSYKLSKMKMKNTNLIIVTLSFMRPKALSPLGIEQGRNAVDMTQRNEHRRALRQIRHPPPPIR